MPKMNGIEATTRILSGCQDAVAIGLSVNANTENREVLKKAGAFDLIIKEVAADKLYNSIRKAFEARGHHLSCKKQADN